MPRNLEIKARIADVAAARAVVQWLGARPAGADEQVDTYYRIDRTDRLKLRTFGDGRAELIHYHRSEATGVRTSDYEVTPVRDGPTRSLLVPATDPVVVVRKHRELHWLDNVRVHLDTVEGLGTFIELEAVVDARHDENACRQQIDRITVALRLREEDLIRGSYADLLRAGARLPAAERPAS